MDRTDKKIIAELQADGRLSLTELADKVGLSLSPCHRRVKNLEETGIISGYRAQIDTARLGLSFSVIVFVSLEKADRQAVSSFEKAVVDVPEVISAQRLFGNPDYMLHVLTRDMESFQRLYDLDLSALPGVQRLTSTLIMKTVVNNRPVVP
ncbi:TPA: Lrp/AsnC family transcriptional regulator [Klebsiella pneumoniae]|nr:MULTISPECIES: Lrp/AsnC family transcriptional regulator [Klebsiella]PII46463.1 AsnC family transcriptional regulator [Klebsiella quasipneumoniae]MCD1431190.1 Lrp/AsnC family transcriptional regulator [Klebsiella pneumoniae]MCD1436555.1 Lrp/AsnC family transcriptional regulator [Klebsiella pneumoniae]MCQ0719822.1 Lrp/AsnC family transcriptional regulator [Klebsiella pneumoniae]MCY7270381.1 Lrp/AsnC family transcriptional regulator [Klebsiella variicola]